MGDLADGHHEQHQTPWWCERELIVVVMVAVATFCVRLDAIPLFGEEPRRALIAREMVETGNWLVPATQHIFLPSRPPLQNWLIAITGILRGSFDAWAVRLPSIIATTLLAILIYGYLRQQFQKLGSFAGAIAFVTMTLVMEFGRSAETEAVFSLFVASSLLLWHWGWMKRWPDWMTWSSGYACVALALLTKGLQAPLYFAGSIGLFLIATNNWRALFTKGHLIGIFVFLLIFGAWQAPFTWCRDVNDSWDIFFSDVAGRFTDSSWSYFLSHLVLFPLELALVRLMPWSLLLLSFLNPRVREFGAKQREVVLFLFITTAFSFVSVWLPPGSKARYFMPLFPSFAALVGIAIDRLSELQAQGIRSAVWSYYVRFMTTIMIGSAVAIIAVSLIDPQSWLALSYIQATAFAGVCVILSLVTWQSLSNQSERQMMQGVIGIAAFFALGQISLVVTVQQRRCEDIAGQVRVVKSLVPQDAEMVSLGPIQHAFAFFYETPIPIVAIDDIEGLESVNYFCLHAYECEPPDLPFEWQSVAVVSCDRFKGATVPKSRVFVGRRLSVQQVSHRNDR